MGALAGGFLPNAMGLGRQHTGSFAPGFLAGTGLALAGLFGGLAGAPWGRARRRGRVSDRATR